MNNQNNAGNVNDGNGEKSKILIIDDEMLNIKALTDILNEEYEVFAEIDSRQAFKTAEEIMPDIILLDVVMPGLNGYEVIKLLKSSEKTGGIPVIFITGLERDEDEATGLSIGAADYISKPFYHSVVKLRVKNQLKMVEQFREIERLSMRDPMTGLPNRRCYENRLNIEWGRAIREKSPLSLLLIDVDKFKDYNDAHGHPQGDVALKFVAKTLLNSLKRTTDLAARWGGEEFAVVLPNTDLQGAVIIAEVIRTNIENMEIPSSPYHDGSAARVTVSIGVNTRTHGQDISLGCLTSGADSSLYEAKNSGRNRVCSFWG
jgi:diguanylate cyclase (GGDEF)-like protein